MGVRHLVRLSRHTRCNISTLFTTMTANHLMLVPVEGRWLKKCGVRSVVQFTNAGGTRIRRGNRMMGNVVRLERPEPRKRGRKAAEPPQVSAEIIIFPGVRYERWDETAAIEPRLNVRMARDFIEL